MTAKTIKVREERPEDILEIRALNLAAFGRSEEGALVEALRANGGVLLSLVALLAERIVGHALYSPVSITFNDEKAVGAGWGRWRCAPNFSARASAPD